MRRVFFLLPIVVFLALLAAMFWGLNSERDPGALPSMLIGKQAPAFSLPGLYDQKMIDESVLADGTPKLLNFFASWCIPCLAEHPVLKSLANDRGIVIIGVAWKNKADDAKGWLEKHGNPYQMTLHDLPGRTGIDWGVYGIPETFLIDGNGKVVFRQAGPLTPQILSKKLMPLLEELDL
ncbi:DsbE family thiol:disulfide interchange protein [Alphaproteobacteria bacterium]|nr:DsbE family thiol:disulfide interchange protein [Alphaproteobacteria bacterium]